MTSCLKLWCCFQLWCLLPVVGCSTGTGHKQEKIEKKGFVLLELFTSEGCSSCPAAERLLGSLKAEDNVYLLSFHVDYWNRLGWKDQFSNADYSARQKRYATQFKIPSVYTPQVVANGNFQFVGSNEKQLQTALSQTAIRAAALSITTSYNNGLCIVNYNLKTSQPVHLSCAVVQKSVTVPVKAGENSGKSLVHTNVVRSFKTQPVLDNKGSMSLVLPNGFNEHDYYILAFVQQQDEQVIDIASSN